MQGGSYSKCVSVLLQPSGLNSMRPQRPVCFQTQCDPLMQSLLLRRRSVQSHDSERTHADGGPNGVYAPPPAAGAHHPPERTPESRHQRKPSPLRPHARNATFKVRAGCLVTSFT